MLPKSKEKEMSQEEKMEIVEAWGTLISVNNRKPDNLEALSKEELKDWLYKDLLGEMEEIMKEWGLSFDEDLIKKINEEKDLAKRALLEFAYIEKCQEQINKYKSGFEGKNDKWDAWPKRLKETGRFNCVGSTLIGTIFLEKAGIKNCHGLPVSHVMNIARLADGQYVYVDLINSKIEKINPQIFKLKEVPVMKIKEKFTDYSLIMIRDKKEIVGSIFGNIDYLNTVATDSDSDEDEKNKEAALEYYNKFKKHFAEVDFSKFNTEYFWGPADIYDTDEMLKEAARIGFIYNEMKEAMENFSKRLTREDEKKLFIEIKNNLDDVIGYFQDDKAKIKKFSGLLRQFVIEYKKAIEPVRQKDTELYNELIQRFKDKF